MGERMRSTNGKFNMPDLSKKTVNQLVSVTAKNWTSAPTGSTEWTKTWKDTLPEESPTFTRRISILFHQR